MTKIIEIPIKEVKQNLSKYIKRVENGDKFVITKHGQPIANITQHTPSIDDSKERVRLAILGLKELSSKIKPISAKDLKQLISEGRDK